MKKSYWIAGVLVVGLGAGVVGMANAHQSGSDGRGGMGPMGQISFEVLDADKDGKVTQAEMDAHKTAEFNKADSNGDGLLSADEMLARANSKMADRMGDRLKQMIARIDTDKDGMLSQAEMQGMPRGKGMFAQLDTDGDGAISAEEFAARKEGRKGGHGMRFGKGHGMQGGMGHGMKHGNAPASE